MRCCRQACGKIGILALTGFGLVLAGLAAFLAPSPRLVWNATASVPRGLYVISANTVVMTGDIVLVALPPAVRRLAAERGYLADGVPLLKPIAAVGGDQICAQGDTMFIAGRDVPRLTSDRAGRALPHWQGCGPLVAEDVFLLADQVPESFDSRYFGPVTVTQIIGKATPLWTE